MSYKQWYLNPDLNGKAPPDGAPEGMARSDVNNVIREVMSQSREFSIKGVSWGTPWYEEPGLIPSWGGSAYGYTSPTVVTFTINQDMNNEPYNVKVGQIIRAVLGSDVWVGRIAVVGSVFVVFQTLEIVWDADLGKDAVGPLSVPDRYEWFGDTGDVGIRNTGTAATEVPTMGDLDAHVLTPEANLDVGLLQGKTAEEVAGLRSPNILANGAFNIWQRGDSISCNVDDLSADCWVVMADETASNPSVTVDRSTDTPDLVTNNETFRYSAELIVQNSGSTAHKSGLMQLLDVNDAYHVGLPDGNVPVSVSLWAKGDGTIEYARVYVLNSKVASPTVTPVTNYFSGTADTDVTFNALEWELRSSARIQLTTNWQFYTPIENVVMDASGAGSGIIAVAVIMDDNGFGNGNRIFMTGLQLTQTTEGIGFQPTDFVSDLNRCYRHFESTFDWQGGTYPAHAQGAASAAITLTGNSSDAIIDYRFRVPKWSVPTIDYYNPITASPGTNYWRDQLSGGGADRAIDASFTWTTREHTSVATSTATSNTSAGICIAARSNIWGNT